MKRIDGDDFILIVVTIVTIICAGVTVWGFCTYGEQISVEVIVISIVTFLIGILLSALIRRR